MSERSDAGLILVTPLPWPLSTWPPVSATTPLYSVSSQPGVENTNLRLMSEIGMSLHFPHRNLLCWYLPLPVRKDHDRGAIRRRCSSAHRGLLHGPLSSGISGPASRGMGGPPLESVAHFGLEYAPTPESSARLVFGEQEKRIQTAIAKVID